MGKKISRNQAADVLGCTPQTVSNYAAKGLIDEFRTTGANGHVYCTYDEEQLRSLRPELTELSTLQERIESERNALYNEQHRVLEWRENARKDLYRFARTSNQQRAMMRFLTGVCTFASHRHPEWDKHLDGAILRRIISFDSIDDAANFLGVSTLRVENALHRLGRRLAESSSMDEEISKLVQENETLRLRLARSRS